MSKQAKKLFTAKLENYELNFWKILDVATLIDRSAMIKVRVDNAKSLIVDRTHPLQASGKQILRKRTIEEERIDNIVCWWSS